SSSIVFASMTSKVTDTMRYIPMLTMFGYPGYLEQIGVVDVEKLRIESKNHFAKVRAKAF
ncbi:hypothetical protein BgiBS90_015280, partial [Biomphalaria glabrata]